MKFLSRIRPARAPETKGLADPAPDLLSIFGIVPAAGGVAITGQQALRIPAVSAAIRLISEAVASLDVMVKSVGSDGVEADATNHPVLPFLRDQANGWTSGFEFIRDLVIDALTDDRGGVAWVNRGSAGVLEIVRYRSGIITVDYDQATGEPRYQINSRPVDGKDIIHLRPPFGRSPLTLAAEAIGLANTLGQHGANLFAKGAKPGGALKFEKGLGEDAIKRIRAIWDSTMVGAENSGKTIILPDGTSYEAIGFSSTDAQFIENRKFQILEIARAFRVPPTMLYDLERATWSNGEQMGMEFLTYTLEPWLRALEGALRRALFTPEEAAGFVIRFDRDDLTRADLATRATVINSLISSRTINPNEGRAWLGLTPRAGGDEFSNPNITEKPAEPAKPDPKEGKPDELQ
jgi:HK97 family phage portal protein